jgi:cytochrome c-type biogenesis protein CcmH
MTSKSSHALLLSVLIVMLSAVASAQAMQATGASAPIVYRDAAEEARFHALASSLRCVMCQNQSLADSDALIARDLRREIIAMMRAGRSDAQIREFLVARYGEFVLYKPRIEPSTWLLWFGPLALFAAGGATVLFVVRRRSARLGAEAAGPKPDAAPEPPPESSEDW